MYAKLLILRSLGPRKYVCLKIHSFKLTFFEKNWKLFIIWYVFDNHFGVNSIIILAVFQIDS